MIDDFININQSIRKGTKDFPKQKMALNDTDFHCHLKFIPNVAEARHFHSSSFLPNL